jgi:hypothetical protein
MSPHARSAVLAAALLAAISPGCQIWRQTPDARTYRMGFQNSPPRQFVDPRVSRTAQSLTWFRKRLSAPTSNSHGCTWQPGPIAPSPPAPSTLWPIANFLPDRSRFHFTEPYAQVTYSLISKLRKQPLIAGATTGRVGVTEGLSRTMAQRHLKQPELIPFASVPALIESICADGVPVGVVGDSA